MRCLRFFAHCAPDFRPACMPGAPARHTMLIMDRIALLLAIIGAVNWGLVGIFQFDLVAFVCGGQGAVVSRIIYTLVGLAGLWCISLLFRERDEVREGGDG